MGEGTGGNESNLVRSSMDRLVGGTDEKKPICVGTDTRSLLSCLLLLG